ncbi:hypothetical protein EON81_17545 [bacterium]|nr:MAG: hypothetical protein EON81_17545 [bacterium]
MKTRFLSFAALSLVAFSFAAGCGGGSSAFGRDAKIKIHLERTDSTQNLTDYEIYITKNRNVTLDTSDRESFASTQNRPSWSDEYNANRSNTKLELEFRTRSSQPPYFVFVRVPSTSSAYETLRFWVDVDGNEGKKITQNLTIGTTQRLTNVTINRESADY